jgi:hypothetical protein
LETTVGHLENPLKTGWLNKKRGNSNKQRYFVLKDEKIHYFPSDEKTTQALGVIDLSKCIAYPSLETTQFIIANKDSGRDYILVSELQSDRDEWLRVLDGVLPQPKKEALRVYLDDAGDSQYCTVAIMPRTTVAELCELVKSKLGNKPMPGTYQIYDDKKGTLYELQNDMSVKELMRLWSERPGRFLYKDKATVTSTKPLVVKEIPPPSSSHSLKNSHRNTVAIVNIAKVVDKYETQEPELNHLTANRAKVQVKRRPPTRKIRQSAMPGGIGAGGGLDVDFDDSHDVFENEYQMSTAPVVSLSERQDGSDAPPAPVKRLLMRPNGGSSQQIISPNGDSSETPVNNSSVSFSDLFGAPAPPPSRRTMAPQSFSNVTSVTDEPAASSDVNVTPVARTDSMNRAAPPPPPQALKPRVSSMKFNQSVINQALANNNEAPVTPSPPESVSGVPEQPSPTVPKSAVPPPVAPRVKTMMFSPGQLSNALNEQSVTPVNPKSPLTQSGTAPKFGVAVPGFGPAPVQRTNSQDMMTGVKQESAAAQIPPPVPKAPVRNNSQLLNSSTDQVTGVKPELGTSPGVPKAQPNGPPTVQRTVSQQAVVSDQMTGVKPESASPQLAPAVPKAPIRSNSQVLNSSTDQVTGVKPELGTSPGSPAGLASPGTSPAVPKAQLTGPLPMVQRTGSQQTMTGAKQDSAPVSPAVPKAQLGGTPTVQRTVSQQAVVPSPPPPRNQSQPNLSPGGVTPVNSPPVPKMGVKMPMPPGTKSPLKMPPKLGPPGRAAPSEVINDRPLNPNLIAPGKMPPKMPLGPPRGPTGMTMQPGPLQNQPGPQSALANVPPGQPPTRVTQPQNTAPNTAQPSLAGPAPPKTAPKMVPKGQGTVPPPTAPRATAPPQPANQQMTPITATPQNTVTPVTQAPPPNIQQVSQSVTPVNTPPVATRVPPPPSRTGPLTASGNTPPVIPRQQVQRPPPPSEQPRNTSPQTVQIPAEQSTPSLVPNPAVSQPVTPQVSNTVPEPRVPQQIIEPPLEPVQHVTAPELVTPVMPTSVTAESQIPSHHVSQPVTSTAPSSDALNTANTSAPSSAVTHTSAPPQSAAVDYSAVFNQSLEENVPYQQSEYYYGEYQYGEYQPSEYYQSSEYQLYQQQYQQEYSAADPAQYPPGYYYDEYGNEYYYSGEYQAATSSADTNHNNGAAPSTTSGTTTTVAHNNTSTPPQSKSAHDSFELSDTLRFTSAADLTDVFAPSEPQQTQQQGVQFMDDNDPMLSTMNFVNLQSEIDKMLGDINAFVPANNNNNNNQ